MSIDLKILDPLFKDIDGIFEKYRNAAAGGAASTAAPSPSSFTSAPGGLPKPSTTASSNQGQPSEPGQTTAGSVPKLPFWRVAYDQGDVPSPDPKKGAPKWKDTWRWEGLLGLLKRGLKGVDPYGKASVHGESKFPTLDQYRSMTRIVEQLIENTFNVVLIEATDAMDAMKTELKDVVKKFFTKHYATIGKSEKESELSGKLSDQLAIVKNLKSELESIRARMKKHAEKRKMLLLKKSMARTNKESEQVASEIVVVDKKIDSTKGKARVISDQQKAAEEGLSSFLDGLSLQDQIDLVQKAIKSRNNLDPQKVEAVQELLNKNPKTRTKGLKRAILDLLVQQEPAVSPIISEPVPSEPSEPKVAKKGRPAKVKVEPPVEPTIEKPKEEPKDVDALLKNLF